MHQRIKCQSNGANGGRVIYDLANFTRLVYLGRGNIYRSAEQCFFCKTMFTGTHILIFDWRPQYSTSLRQ